MKEYYSKNDMFANSFYLFIELTNKILNSTISYMLQLKTGKSCISWTSSYKENFEIKIYVADN